MLCPYVIKCLFEFHRVFVKYNRHVKVERRTESCSFHRNFVHLHNPHSLSFAAAPTSPLMYVQHVSDFLFLSPLFFRTVEHIRYFLWVMKNRIRSISIFESNDRRLESVENLLVENFEAIEQLSRKSSG